jgi:hypothetical protein
MVEPFEELTEEEENLAIQGARLPIGKQAQFMVQVIRYAKCDLFHAAMIHPSSR